MRRFFHKAKNLNLFIVLALFLISFSGVAWAQQATQEALPQQPVTIEVADADLQKFVAVQPALQEIRQDFTQRLEAADNQQAATELQQEAGQLMLQAVEEQGLDVDTYNNIAMALQSDEALRERLQEMM